MEETISLKEIYETLRKHLITIIISMFAGLAISGIVTFFYLDAKIQLASTIDRDIAAIRHCKRQ